jgi:hypothetical protein
VNLIILFICGVLWAATAIAYHRRSRNVCVSCGRGIFRADVAEPGGRAAVGEVGCERGGGGEPPVRVHPRRLVLRLAGRYQQRLPSDDGRHAGHARNGPRPGRHGPGRQRAHPRSREPLGRDLPSLDLVQGRSARPAAARDHPGLDRCRRTRSGRPDERPTPPRRRQLGDQCARDPLGRLGSSPGYGDVRLLPAPPYDVCALRTRCHVPKRRSRWA